VANYTIETHTPRYRPHCSTRNLHTHPFVAFWALSSMWRSSGVPGLHRAYRTRIWASARSALPPQRQLAETMPKNGYRFGFWSTTPNFRETATKRSLTPPKTPAWGTSALPAARPHPGGESCRVTATTTPKQPSCASWRGLVPEWGGALPPSVGPLFNADGQLANEKRQVFTSHLNRRVPPTWPFC